MYESLSLKDLNRLRRQITEAGVHDRPLEPVNPRLLLRDIPIIRTFLPEEINAFYESWYHRWRQLHAIGYRYSLDEHTESASLRHALAHEFGHFFFMHEGDIIYLYREGYRWRDWALGETVMSFQDRQSEAVASYVLIPPEALMEHGKEGPWYLARSMDVPQHLVEIRWQIWGRHHR